MKGTGLAYFDALYAASDDPWAIAMHSSRDAAPAT
jgi:hypothetical protein